MRTDTGWAPPGTEDEPGRGSAVPEVLGSLLDDPALRSAGFRTTPDGHTVHVVKTEPRRRWRRGSTGAPKDRAAAWLRCAMLALAALAAAAAIVSFQAQYQMIFGFKQNKLIALIQAGIPDAGALVFASLAIALALHGKRAIRPRCLNVLCVAISVAMNAIAAVPTWRGLAVWVMAPVLYALASDTLVTVIRAHALARQKELRADLDDDDSSPLAVVGGLLMWLLRLVLAPPSTMKGFRAWVVQEVNVAPGTKASDLTGGDRRAIDPPAGVCHVAAGGAECGRALPCPDHPQRKKGRSRRHGHGGRRRGPARNWDRLSAEYRGRLEASGMTREEYEAGASLDSARGHAGNGGAS